MILTPVVFTDRLRVRVEPCLTIIGPQFEFFTRQGIDESKGGEAGGFVLLPMREIGTGDVERGLGIEEVGWNLRFFESEQAAGRRIRGGDTGWLLRCGGHLLGCNPCLGKTSGKMGMPHCLICA